MNDFPGVRRGSLDPASEQTDATFCETDPGHLFGLLYGASCVYKQFPLEKFLLPSVLLSHFRPLLIPDSVTYHIALDAYGYSQVMLMK